MEYEMVYLLRTFNFFILVVGEDEPLGTADASRPTLPAPDSTRIIRSARYQVLTDVLLKT